MPWRLARAFRFALRVPMCFRVHGEGEWFQGRTENMSRSGVLFSSESAVRLRQKLEMVFVLSPAGDADSTVVLSCEGRVVCAADGQSPARAAAAFSNHRFLRPVVEEA